MVNNIY